MKRVDYFRLMANLFAFQTIQDEWQNTYVMFAHSQVTDITGIKDRTQFEALENHVHLLDNIKKTEYPICVEIAPKLGKVLLNSLQCAFPEKHFWVFVTVSLGGSMIIRFHQKWPGEPQYYPLEGWNPEMEAVFGFDC